MKKVTEFEFLGIKPEDRFFSFLELSRKVNSLFPSKTTFEERTKGGFCFGEKKKGGLIEALFIVYADGKSLINNPVPSVIA